MIRAATIDPSGVYRYDLTRTWDGEGGSLLWCMLNPSTADAEQDDNTIRRVIAFSQREGMGEAVVVNLFALRSRRPEHLFRVDDPSGPANMATILHHLKRCSGLVCAWGAHAIPIVRDRDPRRGVVRLANAHGIGATCLGTTKDGSPRHPLYVRGDAPLKPYDPPSAWA